MYLVDSSSISLVRNYWFQDDTSSCEADVPCFPIVQQCCFNSVSYYFNSSMPLSRLCHRTVTVVSPCCHSCATAVAQPGTLLAFRKGCRVTVRNITSIGFQPSGKESPTLGNRHASVQSSQSRYRVPSKHSRGECPVPYRYRLQPPRFSSHLPP